MNFKKTVGSLVCLFTTIALNSADCGGAGELCTVVSTTPTPTEIGELALVGAMATDNLALFNSLLTTYSLPTRFSIPIRGQVGCDPLNTLLDLNSSDNGEMARSCLAHGADPNVKISTPIKLYYSQRNETVTERRLIAPLEHAIGLGRTAIAQVLLADSRTEIAPPDILVLAAGIQDPVQSLALVSQFLARPEGRALVNARDHDRYTPLMAATLHCESDSKLAVVEVLLAHGAEVGARDLNNKTALEHAYYDGNAQVIARLTALMDAQAAAIAAECAAQKQAAREVRRVERQAKFRAGLRKLKGALAYGRSAGAASDTAAAGGGSAAVSAEESRALLPIVVGGARTGASTVGLVDAKDKRD